MTFTRETLAGMLDEELARAIARIDSTIEVLKRDRNALRAIKRRERPSLEASGASSRSRRTSPSPPASTSAGTCTRAARDDDRGHAFGPPAVSYPVNDWQLFGRRDGLTYFRRKR